MAAGVLGPERATVDHEGCGSSACCMLFLVRFSYTGHHQPTLGPSHVLALHE